MNKQAVINQAVNEGAIRVVITDNDLTFLKPSIFSNRTAFLNFALVSEDHYIQLCDKWEITSVWSPYADGILL